MQPITDIAAKLGLEATGLELYGQFKAKIRLPLPNEISDRQGKLILITSITPTKAGNGKTTTAIGLADGLTRIGKKAILALREPSLGPCFGMKGGAAGAGKSQLVPANDINLHFTGDFHAISSANNMLAALLDNYNFHVQGTPDELKSIRWKRVLDVNDRSLRFIITGLHGGKNGLPTETGFDITPASELMAILCLSKDLDDLRQRIDAILLGYTADDRPLTVKDLGFGGAVTALLKDALQPNLVQTLEGTPALVHGGPFANIAHGCNSLLATQTALQLGDYVLTEAGFGSDLGAEKFVDIKCRLAGLQPELSVLVVTLKSLYLHGHSSKEKKEGVQTGVLKQGLRNVERHVGILKQFGQRVLVVLNQYDTDTAEEIAVLQDWCRENNIPFATNQAYALGGAGTVEAAKMIVSLVQTPSAPLTYAYDLSDPLEVKLRKVVQKVYGAEDIVLDKKARQQLKQLVDSAYAQLPVCIAKTQYSFTDDATQVHTYSGFSITVEELLVNAGAGFIVAVCGEIMRMPGLPEKPNALQIDVQNGEITGLS